MPDYKTLEHSFDPVFDENSKILILGSMPSVKSREISFYYGHPQNRFWKVMASVFNQNLPKTTEEKKRLMLENGIALWDVIARCDIIGSSDSSIKNVVPNDIMSIVKKTKIDTIFVNGSKAAELYDMFCFNSVGIKAEKLPSTSPANASWTTEKLTEVWYKKINRIY